MKPLTHTQKSVMERVMNRGGWVTAYNVGASGRVMEKLVELGILECRTADRKNCTAKEYRIFMDWRLSA